MPQRQRSPRTSPKGDRAQNSDENSTPNKANNVNHLSQSDEISTPKRTIPATFTGSKDVQKLVRADRILEGLVRKAMQEARAELRQYKQEVARLRRALDAVQSTVQFALDPQAGIPEPGPSPYLPDVQPVDNTENTGEQVPLAQDDDQGYGRWL